MFNSTNNTPFTMPVMPATGGYGNVVVKLFCNTCG